MQSDYRDRHRKTAANMRMMKDITMAILIFGMAVVLFFSPQLGLEIELDRGFRLALAALFAIYGLFRLYRGIKKDY
jgi:uncharacterized membrane protein